MPNTLPTLVRAWARLMRLPLSAGLAMVVLSACTPNAPPQVRADDRESLSLYSTRTHPSDAQLYARFTEETGIKVNVTPVANDKAFARINNEMMAPRADVFISVDPSVLRRVDFYGLCAPVNDPEINARIPKDLRLRGNRSFALAQRVRMIFYNRVDPPDPLPTRYEDLADPRYRGEVCLRSSSHPYDKMLIAAMIATKGEAHAEDWARQVLKNLSGRAHKSGDEQLRDLAAGRCSVALANSFDFLRLLHSPKAEDRQTAMRIGWVFPNQGAGDRGAHVSFSGACVIKDAPNPEAARRFLGYLTTPDAQRIFADEGYEYPVVTGVEDSQALRDLGSFTRDTTKSLGASIMRWGLAETVIRRAQWR